MSRSRRGPDPLAAPPHPAGAGRPCRASRLASAGVSVAVAAMLIAGCSPAPTGTGKRQRARTASSTASARPGGSGQLRPADQRNSYAGGRRPVIGVPRTYRAGWRSMTFAEPAHAGPHGRVAARRLLVRTWYPLARRPRSKRLPAHGPFPMVVFAPGFMQCGRPYADMLKFWASAGYVVVVVNFPYADCLAGASATESDMVNEPHDVSYVITRMLALSRAKHGFFAGLLRPRHIAVTGQSDGGDVAAAIAGNTCCADHRVTAVVVESGAEWPPMAGSYFTRRTVPVLFSQGTGDTINPPGCSVAMYLADRSRARYYLNLLGASHTQPYWGYTRYEHIVARVTLAFLNRYLLGRDSAVRAMRRQGNSPGLAALYRNGGGRLTAGYCNT